MDFWQTLRGEKFVSVVTKYLPQLVKKQYIIETNETNMIPTIVSEIEKGNSYVTKFTNPQTNKITIIFEKSIF